MKKVNFVFLFLLLQLSLSACFHTAHTLLMPPSRQEALEVASQAPLPTALLLFIDQVDGRVLGVSDFELARQVIDRMRSNKDASLQTLLSYAELKTELVDIPTARQRARADLRQLLQFAGFVDDTPLPAVPIKILDPNIKIAADNIKFLHLTSLQQADAASQVRSLLDTMRAHAIAGNTSGVKKLVEQFIEIAKNQAAADFTSDDQIGETEIAEALSYALLNTSPVRAAKLLALPGVDPREIINSLFKFSDQSGIQLDRVRLWHVLELSELPEAERSAFILESVDCTLCDPSAALTKVAPTLKNLSAPIEAIDEQTLAELFIRLACDPLWRELVDSTLQKLANPRARAFGWLHSLRVLDLNRTSANAQESTAPINLTEVNRRIEQALLEAQGDLSDRERIELLLELDNQMNKFQIAPTPAMQALFMRMLSLSWRELTP